MAKEAITFSNTLESVWGLQKNKQKKTHINFNGQLNSIDENIF